MKQFIVILLLLFIFYTPTYAQAVDIGYSRIDPASPLYFLKAVREILELKFAGTGKVVMFRQLEFATRRVREVKSLAATNPQLIQANLERYWVHLKVVFSLKPKDPQLDKEIFTMIASHMLALEQVYNQVNDKSARMSIRSTIYKIENRLNVPPTVKLSACDFLSKEATSSALNEVEKVVLNERVQNCLQSLK